MLKRYLFSFLFLLLGNWAIAQEATEPLRVFNEKHFRIKRIGMLTLGSWAVANMGVSGLSISGATGSNRYFHQMNVYWNVVNLTLAGFGYYGAAKANPATLNLAATVKEYYGIEKTLLLNVGLDVAYVLGGLYLTERARNVNKQTDMLKGFGQSIMLQGGFLLLFDTAFYLVINHHGKALSTLLSGLTFTGNGVALIVKL